MIESIWFIFQYIIHSKCGNLILLLANRFIHFDFHITIEWHFILQFTFSLWMIYFLSLLFQMTKTHSHNNIIKFKEHSMSFFLGRWWQLIVTEKWTYLIKGVFGPLCYSRMDVANLHILDDCVVAINWLFDGSSSGGPSSLGSGPMNEWMKWMDRWMVEFSSHIKVVANATFYATVLSALSTYTNVLCHLHSICLSRHNVKHDARCHFIGLIVDLLARQCHVPISNTSISIQSGETLLTLSNNNNNKKISNGIEH